MTQGCFFVHHRAEPHFNMAFDEWLLGEALDSPGFVALRLYSWAEGTVTFGFNQHKETALDWTHLGATPAIRRVTGGRALYHDLSELTYAVVVNQQGLAGHPLGGTLTQSSGMIAEGLVSFLSHLGIRTDYQRQSSPENSRPGFFHKAPCFASVSKYEVIHEHTKIIASAQKRLSGCLLQHGAIKLNGLATHPALAGVDGTTSGIPGSYSLDEFARLAGLFCDTFAEVTGIPFRDGQLDGSQNLHVDRLVAYLKINPYARREIIKQATDANSL
jgi:lipoate-protein ligase A